ncbi:SymE family type I addiction module toxin [Atlantibacter sp.]|uniref:SymE family type I addiction module toxin n=1 Tax=Atlantibacter sp. TaxID=1903473 RepID=UPI0028B1B583|nr:SymE family type I addiction module toxin [Atlantibacter sp.]
MANTHSTKAARNTRTDKPLIVGYRPQGGDTSTPQITLSGKWLCEAGFAPGQHYMVKISEGCLVLVAMNTQEEALLTQLDSARQTVAEMKRALNQIGNTFKAA